MATRLTGFAAIDFAERSGARLCKKPERHVPAADDLTPAEAREVAARNPELIYIDFDEDSGPTRLV